MIEILMPALSPTMKTGHIAKWYKKPGDQVEAGDVLVDIETDKATMGVEAVDDGIFKEIVVEEGAQNIPINTVIAYLDDSLGDTSTTEDTSTAAAGQLSATQPAQPENTAQKEIKNDTPKNKKTSISERIMASPLAKRLAQEYHVDLSTLKGSGPRGRIVEADVKAAGKQDAAPSPARTNTLKPLSSMRQAIAQRVSYSKKTVPHFYLELSCRIDALLELRQAFNKKEIKNNIKLSVNDFIIKATAMTLHKVPEANMLWQEDTCVPCHNIDISVAVSVDQGLYMPFVRNPHNLSLVEIHRTMAQLITQAREGTLTPDAYDGGSFSLSNLGMYGIDRFQAIVNPPQTCILAVGAGKPALVPGEKGTVQCTLMTCTLSVDHRAIDGALAAQWLQTFKETIEAPWSMMCL